MKKLLIVLLSALTIWACSNKSDQPKGADKPEKSEAETFKMPEVEGLVLNDPLNQEMVENGKAIYQLKCAACHKLSAKRVVGPGWEGVSKKRSPEWIINMITNVDVMLDKDPEAQKLLEECLTRMPNQNVSAEDARDILEFIFQNDLDRGIK